MIYKTLDNEENELKSTIKVYTETSFIHHSVTYLLTYSRKL